jgi:uncharacterized protein YjbI with pentapeptide repeats
MSRHVDLSRWLVIASISVLCGAWNPVEENQPCPRPKERCAQAADCKFTETQVQQILIDHRAWLERWNSQDSPRSTPENLKGRANFCNANLHRLKLKSANLRQANLQGADLSETELDDADLFAASLVDANLNLVQLRGATLDNADLRNANLTAAILADAKLVGADLRGADLHLAKLQNAILQNAKLEGANLNQAGLEKAELRGANLRGADLSNAVVTEAILAFTDLSDANYSPVSKPPNLFVAGIRGLDTVAFRPGQEVGLIQLRELLQKGGHRELERQATYAIERGSTKYAISEWRNSWRLALEGIFRRVAFDWTTAYGMKPGRALMLIVAVWLALIPIYAWVIWRQSYPARPRWGIYRVWPRERIEITDDGPTLDMSARVERLCVPAPALFGWSAYFSLLSAFQLGFREFSVGTWIARAQPRSFSLDSSGWVRTISGIQSLVSLCLLALWVLTYFGRPFQ